MPDSRHALRPAVRGCARQLARSARGFVLCGALLLLAACGDRASDGPEPPGPLPADPQQWICARGAPAPSEADVQAWCRAHPDRGRPLPDDLRDPPSPEDFAVWQAYNLRLETFLTTQQYVRLGWVSDARWRFSGPSIVENGSYARNYGPHFPLRVSYSPEIVEWLCNGREGDIPDGAMIVKAMNITFDQLDIRTAADGCMDIVEDPQQPIQPQLWAPMIKTSRSSYDGWYWTLQQPDLGIPPQFGPPLLNRSGFTGGKFPDPIIDDPAWYPTGGILQLPLKVPNVVPLIPLAGHPYCLSCHATAAAESTFSSLDNVLGSELRYKAFDPGPDPEPAPSPIGSLRPFPAPLPAPSELFLTFFDQLPPVAFADVWATRMPAETWDQLVLSAHEGPGQFLTSAQCDACHNATAQSPLLPQMVLVTAEPGRTSRLRNLSPYGEWRVSPMGLAGRDPMFFAQLQSETNRLPDLDACIETTCLHCHGVMGARQWAADTASDPACEQLFAIPPPPDVPFGSPFRRAVLAQWPGEEPSGEQRYAALARDGVSCTVCHHVADTDLGEERSFTGNFVTGPADELYGPYATDTVKQKPMQHALGLTPMHGAQVASSELCGSCHNVLLPIYANDGRRLGASYEQATHLEWTNSDSGRPGKAFRSCQDCHMPKTFRGTKLAFEIASSESAEAFPPTTNRLPDDDIQPALRDRYSRHALHGLNVFLNQMAQQFPLLLGIQQIDFMSEQASSIDPPAPPFRASYPMELPLLTGLDSMLDMAANETATVELARVRRSGGLLEADVTVENLTGHDLPTGVGFRRMFLELLVLDAEENVLWASGRTNALGFLVDGTGDTVLPSEQPQRFPDAAIQPHYQTITASDQVQIYQELIRDSDGRLTTSFLRRVDTVKDNRIRPKGYDPGFFARSDSPYVRELAELHGAEADDPDYTDPRRTGADRIAYRIALDPDTLARADHVRVTLQSQSIPPFFLQDRFADAAYGPARRDDIERLHYVASRLDVDAATDDRGNPVLEGWKLRIAGATARVR
ncbi:hypothetical protein K2Z84_15660 [Candidatus Binatia bacterium]|nr:hypothetical protein [Candidatus Binatia bacterium]